MKAWKNFEAKNEGKQNKSSTSFNRKSFSTTSRQRQKMIEFKCMGSQRVRVNRKCDPQKHVRYTQTHTHTHTSVQLHWFCTVTLLNSSSYHSLLSLFHFQHSGFIPQNHLHTPNIILLNYRLKTKTFLSDALTRGNTKKNNPRSTFFYFSSALSLFTRTFL